MKLEKLDPLGAFGVRLETIGTPHGKLGLVIVGRELGRKAGPGEAPDEGLDVGLQNLQESGHNCSISL